MKIDPVELTKKLISFKSITPRDDGAIEHIAAILEKSGFDCEILEFGDNKTKVKNLYAKYINGVQNLCFAGHVDVVPPGQLKDWISDPFSPEVRDGLLYGRGATDMKSGIAAFITAMVDLVAEKFRFNGSISALITSAEESTEEYGTKAVLKWMESKHKKIDYCVVAEPTSSEKLGDTIKIGRRGSATFELICHGKQGHVAYPDLADNPIYKMISILNRIKDTTFDGGNKYFQPSNCEITTIDVGNSTDNVILDSITAGFNIRYNNMQTPDGLYKLIDEICFSVTNDYKLSMHSSRGAFLSTPDRNTDVMFDAINKVTNIDAVLATSGGTSDAAFIKDVCPVIEFGMINKTSHQVNECVLVNDIHKLTAIYKEFIKSYFYPTNRILNQINVIGNVPDSPLLA
ncbi:succinyl-diaminopimelate desuccinylase [Wolbachia endosymbiont of Brugia malayi]|uniref:Succinyl-diaminopimelate desuccinylase n=1 Tax=Wolbachia sp. subsp. Brugia malayi (strain TRS) TaxID=292805 RepID=DAPE_WOLTR|nr:succinyl-diaminopimelate desuccinylase [Wolbachia endosymbiont of Brugia malayi]Q5GS68.1 RecName: Full=Succinyl-diaminopimelate desuccinylase; Short=SDAP desuccinylase; AltName: Full=N-succinyl-LL-2,6-diaminoheptanedioate amidohydrolase [Wolbachia endosymbiont strain TRS of Brugia malayi]AAW71156.1 Acetylornithine deacetylase/Succinyl-diaminopimelate desuccinylase [Wolbachia endosymbiont strain TRS of Brugia malayi]QCB61356.1 succinyl-diaminopimelate desuccinylase [Wolbachia endosymbiont of B